MQGSATGCWFRIRQKEWVENTVQLWINREVWAVLIPGLGSLLRALYISLLFSSLLCVYAVLYSSLGSQRHVRAPIARTTGPTGTSGQTSLREDMPCWELRSAFNCSFMALTPIQCLSQHCKSGLWSPDCGQFCVKLRAKIKACEKYHGGQFMVRLSICAKKCVKSSIPGGVCSLIRPLCCCHMVSFSEIITK